jgi:hypothetical protein
MEQRLSVVTIGAANLSRTRGVYEDIGWKAGLADYTIVFFQLDGLIFAIFGDRQLTTIHGG